MRAITNHQTEAAAITAVIQGWALFRDICDWESLAACYAPDARMKTTWFEGAASDFVVASRELTGKGARAQHFMGASTVEVHGERATAESRFILLLRGQLGEQQVDVTCYGRFFDRLVRHGQQWAILAREPIYEKDSMQPVAPGQAVHLDPLILQRYPEGYRHIAYLQCLGGARITTDLVAPNSAAQSSLYEAARAWLANA